ncbi:hypothetical protein FO519_004098 [Halicephalobus sp. NKZ332]|nr:hypothetical protein FO519_004098 [Halicephalobus sp. NKZ332]
MDIVYKWTGLEFIVRGSEYLDSDESLIAVANHQSALDIYTMMKVYPRNCSVILKSSLKFFPVFNWMMYLGDSIFIDRFTKEKSKDSLALALEKIKKSKRKIFMYPEGTRNSKKELLPFKKGAFILSKEANVPVVPIVFSRYSNFLNHEEKRWDYGGKIIIQVLPPMKPGDFANLDMMADECKTKMEKQLSLLEEELKAS